MILDPTIRNIEIRPKCDHENQIDESVESRMKYFTKIFILFHFY